MGVTGSIRKLSLAGVGYHVHADSDFTEVPATLNEAIATSGPVVHTITKQVASVSGVELDGSDPIAYQLLLNLQDQISSFTISYTTADGSAFSGTGKINLENRTTREGRVSIMLTADTAFTLIPA